MPERAAIEREIRQRKHVYPRRLVAAGKMADGFSAAQIALMEAIREDCDPYFDEIPAQGEMIG